MRKIWKIVIGGLGQKIFNMVLITIILMVGVFSGVLIYQFYNLKGLIAKTDEKQMDSISLTTQQIMDGVLDSNMTRETLMEAEIADAAFRNLKSTVTLLADYTKVVLEHPEDYKDKFVDLPDASRDGEVYLQLLHADGVNVNSPEIAEKIRLLGNMSDMMVNLYNAADINACFVGLPNGVFLITDERSGSKFDENGKIRNMPVTERDWYVKAEELGDVYFSNVETDFVTGKPGIVCSIPIYVDGRLEAVVGADYFLDTMDEAVQATAEEDKTLVCILNQNGQVIFAPGGQTAFTVEKGDDSADLRSSSNKELAQFVTDVLQAPTDCRRIQVGQDAYYMCGAPLSTLGWAVVNFVDDAKVHIPAQMLKDNYNEINEKSQSDFRKSLKKSESVVGLILLGNLLLIFFVESLLIKRIVRPLNTITKRISELNETNPQFMMEDSFRTGDEIEVLAQSFADISEKTVRYMDAVQVAAREKERMETELGMATAIQASQVPHLFPAFPNRKDFDIYASMTPAKEVGGDFYDFFLLDEEHIVLVMADVSGKGVPAALFMMVSKILIRNRVQSGESLEEAVANVNRQLMEGNETNMFVTLWIAIVDVTNGKGIAINAGHEHPVIRRAGGKYELVKYRHSPAVAVMEDIPFKSHTFELSPGDSIFVYTDGVPEATNHDKQLMGLDRMVDALNENPDAAPEEVLKNMMNAINSFTAGAEQFDDITMLSFNYAGPVPEKG